MTSQTTSPRRNFGLDLARALAITMVFLGHGVSSLHPLRVGVDLFFLLSGFLIGRIYLRSQGNGTFTLFGFWQARWFRTLPPYLIALALFAIADLHRAGPSIHPYYLLFLQNYLGIDDFGPSWSLCVEEHFYLALPLLGFLFLRFLGRRSLLWGLPLLALVPQAIRMLDLTLFGLPPDWYWRTHLHCEGLVLGVWLAYVFTDRPTLWQKLRAPSWPIALLPFAVLAFEHFHKAVSNAYNVTAFLLYAIGYAAWIRLLYDLQWDPKDALGRALKFIVHGLALASYSIYLVHILVFTLVRSAIEGWSRGAIKSGTILLTTLALSILFYFLIERPTILLRDRYLHRT